MVYTIVVHLYAKDDKEAISKLQAKLREASLVYSNDYQTISWFVMQDLKDPRAFTIVERYENEGSQKYHLDNPYWQTFDPFVKPLLAKDMDLRRLEELLPEEPVKGKDTTKLQIDEKYKVEKDPELWKKVEEHQKKHLRDQGNY